ncbi:Nif3-like dinuclear metal center hexameric protein [Paludibacter sp.]
MALQLCEITNIIESFAPLSLQESYDNAGLIIGSPDIVVSGVLLCVDITEEVIEEAISKKCNLIISHHPLIFNGLKRINGKNSTQRCVIKAIKNDIAIYAAHTNLDNVINGVNGIIADKLGLINRNVLLPKQGILLKLSTFVPKLHLNRVREALFNAGAGHIGNYDSCSFNVEGFGSFRAKDNANPFVGKLNELHFENEIKLEVILPEYIKTQIINALIESHPYEEPAFDIYPILNQHSSIGLGIIGELEQIESENTFLSKVKEVFDLKVLKHTKLLNKDIKKVAICGGSGSFLIEQAISKNADIFISGDFKYHDYFNAENKIVIADIGHFETEQFTKELFYKIIQNKFPTFAVHISKINTNPILYF